MDFSKVKSITIPEGKVKQILLGSTVLWKSGYTNMLPNSIDTDGSIFDGVGYRNGYRLNSSGGLSEQSNTFTTGFIPCTANSLIRLGGPGITYPGYGDNSAYCYLCFYDANFNCLGSQSNQRNSQYSTGIRTLYRGIVVSNEKYSTNSSTNNPRLDEHDVAVFDNYSFTDGSQVAYFRINGIGDGVHAVVTVNDEIVYAFTNRVKTSTEADDVTIYNGGLGYKNGYRIRSGGTEATIGYGACIGYLPAVGGDVVRMFGYDALAVQNANAINVFDKNHTNLGQTVAGSGTAGYGIFNATWAEYNWFRTQGVKEESQGVYAWTIPPDESIAYIRVSGYTGDGSMMLITINEEIEW